MYLSKPGCTFLEQIEKKDSESPNGEYATILTENFISLGLVSLQFFTVAG